MSLGIGLDGISVPGTAGFTRKTRVAVPEAAGERELVPIG
jgi:hypothetical protein